MNWNGFCALDFAAVGYAELPWSVFGTDGFSISVRCLTDCGEESGTLVSLDQLFSAGLEKGYLYIETGRIRIRAKERIPVRCWNKFTVTYNGTIMRAYCNNALLAEAEAVITYKGAGKLRSGQGFKDSYIQRIAQYNGCLTENEIMEKLFQKKDGDAVWQADFGIGVSEGGNYREEWLHGCRVENLVYALDCKEGELAAVLPAKLRPEYSILCTCCFREMGQAEKNAGKILSLPGLEMSIREGDESGCVFLSVSGGETPVEVYVRRGEALWMDLALVNKADHLVLYMNGKQIGRTGRGCLVSPGRMEFGKFPGYIDSCAVIDRAVTEEEIQRYRNCPPHVFEKDLRYLFCFADSIERECCHGLPLLAEGTGIVLVKETGAEIRPAGVDFPGPAKREKEYSKFARWQTETVLFLLVEWIAAWMGKYPNRGVSRKDGKLEIEEGLYAFAYREIVSLPEAQELLANYDNLTEELLLDLIYKMKETGVLAKLLGYLYQEDADWDSAAPLLLALLLAAGVFLKSLMPALAAALKAAPAAKPPEPPEDSGDDDDDDEEKKKKKTYLSIRQKNVKGNVEVDAGAEKEVENRAALYWKEGENSIKLTVEISCKGEGGEFVIKAGNKPGSILNNAEETRTLASGQTTSVEVNVQLKRTDRKYGKWKETVHWSSEAKNPKDGSGKKFLRDVEYEIHILEGKPCGPWEEKVRIECLELCAACAEYAGGSSKGFREDYARWLKESGLATVNRTDRGKNAGATNRTVTRKATRKSYSRLPEQRTQKKAAFDILRFSRDFPERRREISAADLAYSYTLFCRLQGQPMNSVVIDTGLEGGFLLENEQRLPLKRIHYVNKDERNGIYDYVLDSYGLPFSDNPDRDMVGRNNPEFYREKNYIYGSYCRILAEIHTWQMEELPEEGNIPAWEDIPDACDGLQDGNCGSVVRKGDGRYALGGRNVWTREIKNRFPARGERDESRCHSISSINIDRVTVNMLNGYVDERRANEEGAGVRLRERMECLKAALWPEGHPEARREDELAKEGMENLMSRLCLNVRRDNPENINDFLVHLSCSMYNAPWNLRIGNSKWNSSIRENFDPFRWFYYNGEKVSGDNDAMDWEPWPPAEYYQMKNLMDWPLPQEAGFYLPDVQDGIRLCNFRNADWNREIGIQVKKENRVDNDGGELRAVYPFVSSSSNQFPHHEVNDGRGNLELTRSYVFYFERQGRAWVRLG